VVVLFFRILLVQNAILCVLEPCTAKEMMTGETFVAVENVTATSPDQFGEANTHDTVTDAFTFVAQLIRSDAAIVADITAVFEIQTPTTATAVFKVFAVIALKRILAPGYVVPRDILVLHTFVGTAWKPNDERLPALTEIFKS